VRDDALVVPIARDVQPAAGGEVHTDQGLDEAPRPGLVA
jgi:hypothetical protein